MYLHELKDVIANNVPVKLVDSVSRKEVGVGRYEDRTCIPDSYDELEVIRIDVCGGCLEIAVEIPQVTVTGKLTLDIEVTIKAFTQNEVDEILENIGVSAYGDMVQLDYDSEEVEDVDLTFDEFDWDSPTY